MWSIKYPYSLYSTQFQLFSLFFFLFPRSSWSAWIYSVPYAAHQEQLAHSLATMFLRSLLFLLSLLFSCPTCLYAARLVDFQVAQPPPLPLDAPQCTVLILE
jgi:hypothetical protein